MYRISRLNAPTGRDSHLCLVSLRTTKEMIENSREFFSSDIEMLWYRVIVTIISHQSITVVNVLLFQVINSRRMRWAGM